MDKIRREFAELKKGGQVSVLTKFPEIGTTVVASVCRGTNSIVVKIISKWKEVQHTDPKVFTAYASHEGEVTMIDTCDFEDYDYAEGWLDGDANDPEIKKAKKLAKELGLKFPYEEIFGRLGCTGRIAWE